MGGVGERGRWVGQVGGEKEGAGGWGRREGQ